MHLIISDYELSLKLDDNEGCPSQFIINISYRNNFHFGGNYLILSKKIFQCSVCFFPINNFAITVGFYYSAIRLPYRLNV